MRGGREGGREGRKVGDGGEGIRELEGEGVNEEEGNDNITMHYAMQMSHLDDSPVLHPCG